MKEIEDEEYNEYFDFKRLYNEWENTNMSADELITKLIEINRNYKN